MIIQTKPLTNIKREYFSDLAESSPLIQIITGPDYDFNKYSVGSLFHFCRNHPKVSGLLQIEALN